MAEQPSTSELAIKDAASLADKASSRTAKSSQEIVISPHDFQADMKQLINEGVVAYSHQKGNHWGESAFWAIIFLTAFLFSFTLIYLLTTQLQRLGVGLRSTSKGLQLNTAEVTAVFVVTNYDEKAMVKSVKSFQQGTTGMKIIIGCNRNLSIDTLSKLGNVRWVFTRKNLDLSFLDQLVGLVDTQYFLFASTEWESEDNSFIAESVKLLKQNSDVAQVIMDSTLPKDSGPQQRATGFSFSPSLHRTSDFTELAEGYSGLVGSECKISTQCQNMLSQHYFTQGKHILATSQFKFKRYEESEEKIRQFQTAAIEARTPKKKSDSKVETGFPKQIEEPKPVKPLEEPTPTPVIVPENHPITNSRLVALDKTLKEGPRIMNNQQISRQKELPFCLLLLASADQALPISNSVARQQYKNYKLIDDIDIEKVNYYELKKIVKEKCQKNSVLMFLNLPIVDGALSYMNRIYQRNRVYLIYTKTGKSFEIVSVLSRVYDLLGSNDFDNKNQVHLKSNNRAVQLLGMLELCTDYNKAVKKGEINDIDEQSYFSMLKNSIIKYKYQPYTKLLRLSQDMPTSVYLHENWMNDLGSKRRSPRSGLTQTKMLHAIERQQQWFLPRNHSIAQLQLLDYDTKYNISQYKEKSKQVPFCVTIISHNNIQNRRYIKVVQSVIQQEYENYHIVFVDDNSTDATLKETKNYFNEVKFPKERVTYIKNIKRNYATFNILNAAFNYCKQDDIQLLVDGDDELIGKYAFQVMNAAYQQNPSLWVVYSNYKTSNYDFGRSVPLSSEFEHLDSNGKRLFISSIGPIRTWRIKLLYNIPIEHHKMQSGEWLDTVYDDALQHPLLELATVKRVKYLSEILYEYNVRYGDNDDSTAEKVSHRTTTFRYILTLKPLKPIKDLNGSKKNAEVERELREGKGVKYVEDKD